MPRDTDARPALSPVDLLLWDAERDLRMALDAMPTVAADRIRRAHAEVDAAMQERAWES